MASPRLTMRQVREVLRLKFESRRTHREVARALRIGMGTVSEYLSRAAAAGLRWPLPPEMDDAALEARLFPSPAPPSTKATPDWAWVHGELKRKGVTLQLLWSEYAEAVGARAFRYSWFCDHYREWASRLLPSMRQEHRAGEKVFVDFSGAPLWITDRNSGVKQAVQLFVGVLGASSYTYAEAVATQRVPDWIAAHVRMIEYFGGSAEIWVPDQLKSGVTGSCRYEPEIQHTYSDAAAFYGAVVIPARPRKPRDKAKVEVAVLVAERWILARLRNRVFHSLAELNTAIRELLIALNNRRMRHVDASRRELYERLDRPALRPLPPRAYEIAEWKVCRVNIDYHIAIEYNTYSVPYELLKEQLEARLSSSTVEVFFKGRRVAAHRRLLGKGQRSTQLEHMPASHRAHAEWTPTRLIHWAEKTGPATGRVVAQILDGWPHPEMGYRSVLGIMRLGREHGADRLEAACRRVLTLSHPSYKTVKNILRARMDSLPFDQPTPAPRLPAHENIRGAAYFAGKEDEC